MAAIQPSADDNDNDNDGNDHICDTFSIAADL